MADQTIEMIPARKEPSVRIEVIAGPHAGESWPVQIVDPVTIGRRPPANLRLPDDDGASGVHCKMEIDGNQLHVTDLESSNGTWLNGLRVQSGTVRPDDVIAIGQSELQLSLLSIPNHGDSKPVQSEKPSPSHSHGSTHVTGGPRKKKTTRITAPKTPTQVSPDGVHPRKISRNPQRPSGAGVTHDLEETIDGPGADLSWHEDEIDKRQALPRPFSNYQLLEMIGQGGMATVYRAVQSESGATVAIKLIRAGGKPSKKQLSLFSRESKLILRLKHPRIVRAYEMGFHDDQPFLAMEYLPTIDLLSTMTTLKPKARIRTSAWVISRLLQALHHAHREGIVHRDVKIANLLAFREGHRLQVKLADFGLAKIVVDSGISQLTNERSIRGTLAFMAPEQIKESRAVGFPADLYATGVCLIRLLGGELPKPAFESTGLHIEKVLRSLDSVPQALLQIIRKATAPLVPDRYPNAESMAKDLHPLHQRP